MGTSTTCGAVPIAGPGAMGRSTSCGEDITSTPGCPRVIRTLRGRYTCVIRCRHDSVATLAAPVRQQWQRVDAYARHANDRVVLGREPCLGMGLASASFSMSTACQHVSAMLPMPR